MEHPNCQKERHLPLTTTWISHRGQLAGAALETICCLAAIALPGMSTTAQAAQVSVHEVDVQAILGEIRRPGAKVVLVSVWASLCDPCRAEMPGLLKFFREHNNEGLRLVLVSVDDDADRDKMVGFLASQRVDFSTWIKHDMDAALSFRLTPPCTRLAVRDRPAGLRRDRQLWGHRCLRMALPVWLREAGGVGVEVGGEPTYRSPILVQEGAPMTIDDVTTGSLEDSRRKSPGR
jgi:thiol-disulfide isomerase/thioredoxin